ncbi:glycoside hydrolase superfamily [Mycena maculata]|uniref:Beta-xylanase n=1 Tax=Mycena maculata TaxID=230809 RepID=A0AAD7IBI3_9AGAR|nr:glycoside hydrolase superfamily [Mycena maculata]
MAVEHRFDGNSGYLPEMEAAWSLLQYASTAGALLGSARSRPRLGMNMTVGVGFRIFFDDEPVVSISRSGAVKFGVTTAKFTSAPDPGPCKTVVAFRPERNMGPPPTELRLLTLPLLAQAASFTPDVSLLTDLPQFQGLLAGKTTMRSVLNTINHKNLKGTPFYFGSTLADPTVNPQNAAWTSERFDDTWNLIVAENDCKWFSNEPMTPGVFNLTACESLRDYAFQHGDVFRGHNTFWHNQRPDWLANNPFEFTVAELNKTIIPDAVETVIEGLGPNLISWDVVNEALSDSATIGMNLTECVLSADRWPNFAIDGNASSPVLFPDSSFINTAFLSADQARKKIGSSMKLFYNDYNAKTECAFKLLAQLQQSGVGIDGVGIQSHYSANPQAFPSKESAHFTMDRLKSIGIMGAITEMDVWLPDNTTESVRWQASIFGDILDTCLFSSNCNEFLVWDNRDDESWLDPLNDTGVHMGTLFDSSGNPKLPYFEVLARLSNFAEGGQEPCATSEGTSVCVL